MFKVNISSRGCKVGEDCYAFLTANENRCFNETAINKYKERFPTDSNTTCHLYRGETDHIRLTEEDFTSDAIRGALISMVMFICFFIIFCGTLFFVVFRSIPSALIRRRYSLGGHTGGGRGGGDGNNGEQAAFAQSMAVLAARIYHEPDAAAGASDAYGGAGAHASRRRPLTATDARLLVDEFSKRDAPLPSHNAVCPICLDPMDDTSGRSTASLSAAAADVEHSTSAAPFVVLPCSHAYHTECIRQWFRKGSASCPYCAHCLTDELLQLRAARKVTVLDPEDSGARAVVGAEHCELGSGTGSGNSRLGEGEVMDERVGEGYSSLGLSEEPVDGRRSRGGVDSAT